MFFFNLTLILTDTCNMSKQDFASQSSSHIFENISLLFSTIASIEFKTGSTTDWYCKIIKGDKTVKPQFFIIT